MLRGGGLCLAGPGDPSLNKVSPRIRALQDRLMDSLPSDGAWECLSPAQREAILSLHRCRTTSTDDSSEHGEGGRHGGLRKPPRLRGIPRFARSRSYDDRLESETDDSGIRGVNTSSGAASHNSLEDDSSDTGLKRGPGRFAKAASADRFVRRDGKTEPHDKITGKNIRKSDMVTNGLGNVNKIISKQMSKCSGLASGPSNITLDCRNVQGEKRRRSRIDVNDPFTSCSVESSLEAIRENEAPRRNGASDSQQTRLGHNRKNVLMDNFESETKLHALKEQKETVSSEEYDSGVNFKNDDSMDEYVRDRQNGGCEFTNNFESDRTPPSDTSTSPTVPHKRDCSLDRLRSKGEDSTPRKLSGERNPVGGWDRSLDNLEKNRSREIDGKTGLSHSLDKHAYADRPKSTKPTGEPLKSNLKVGYSAKLNSSFDYRTNLNQDQLNKYSSNWNNIILSKDLPIKPSNAVAGNQAAAGGRESRFAKNTSGGVASRSPVNLANKTGVAQKKTDPVSCGVMSSPKRTPNTSQDRGASKKYLRSKSLDRKYLEDDSSDEDSDFETRRRTDRVRRYQRASQDWEVGRPRAGDDRSRQRGKDMMESKQLRRNHPVHGQPMKARSVWDLSGYSKKSQEEFDDFDDVGFRTRSDFRNKWQSEESDVTRPRRLSENSESSRKQWNRRSCDFELEFQNDDLDRRSVDKSDFDRKRWYRRSCDLDLDFELHNRERREVEFDTDWGQQPLENCDEFDAEFAAGKGKGGRTRFTEQQLLQMQSRGKTRCDDLLLDDRRRGEDDKGRRTRLDDVNEHRIRLEDDLGRRTRLEDHYRSKTSMGLHGREKRERSRTPHLLRGKLRLLKSILFF